MNKLKRQHVFVHVLTLTQSGLVAVQRQFSILTHSPQGKRWWPLEDCAWSCVPFRIRCVVGSVKRLGGI